MTSGVKQTSSLQRPVDLNLNSTNIVSGTNNSKMKITFQSGSIDITNKEICLKKFSCYNSFPNITTATSFQYKWWDNSTVTVSLSANSNYNEEDINLLLEYTMFINHHFLYDENDTPPSPVYYASIVSNRVAYAFDLQSILSPVNLSSAGTGYQVPFDYNYASSFQVTGTNLLTITATNVATARGTPAITAGQTFLISGCTSANNLQWNNTLQVAASANTTTITVTLVGATNYGATAETDAIICPPTTSGASLWIFPSTRANVQFVLANAPVLSLLGFSAGSYPTTLTGTQANYSISSNNGVPQINPVSAILIHCNLITQQQNMYPTLLDSTDFGDSAYGTIISYAPNIFSYQPMGNGNKESLEIFLTDQDGDPLVVLDEQWNITIQIREVSQEYRRIN